MNKDTFQGRWHEIKGQVKNTWGKLTDDDLTQIDGRREELLGTLQRRYGYARENAEKEVERFENSCECTEERDFDQENEYFVEPGSKSDFR